MFSLFYLYIVRNDDNKDDQSIILRLSERGPSCEVKWPSAIDWEDDHMVWIKTWKTAPSKTRRRVGVCYSIF